MNTESAIFHEGEIAVQNKVGVREKSERMGRMVIRDHMPQQHRDFYHNLPMVFAGHEDPSGQVWASVLVGEKGFIDSDSNTSLSINALPLKGDPLNHSLHNIDKQELRLGILGIELHTRRRNRLSAKVSTATKNGFKMDVLQTFGNCPQYIQNREMLVNTNASDKEVVSLTRFDDKTESFITNSDTFFVASSSKKPQKGEDVVEGADVSHRGGRPGFIKVEDGRRLIIPDFNGNNAFNTLGNFHVNPSAGLLFIDFTTGDVLTLTGKAQILWDHTSQSHFKGANRFWQFELEFGYLLRNALPYVFKLHDESQNNHMTGTWQEASALELLEEQKNAWHKFSVKKIKDESKSIRSFWLEFSENDTNPPSTLPAFQPGQHITLKAEIDGKLQIRNYTVSTSPHDSAIRISVKRDGLFSNWLHDNIRVNDVLDIKLPSGSFTLSPHTVENMQKPLVLLSAGIGITPMISMLRHSVFEEVRTRNPRPIIMFNTFRKAEDMAFLPEVSKLTEEANGSVKAFWLLTDPEHDAVAGKHYSAKGRLNKEMLQQVLPIGKYEFYLCGPAGFMQSTYDMLLELNVLDEDINTEAFGPSSLKRRKVKVESSASAGIHAPKPQPEIAESALVEFKSSQVEQVWHKDDGNLLQFAETHGLTPEYGCRGGTCGSCKVKVVQGKVSHIGDIAVTVNDDEALLCCAVPAKTDNEEPKLVVGA